MWFKSKPVPPPKYQLPAWISIAIPIIFAIILGLLGLVYNGMASDLEILEHDKADKEITYKQIEQNQRILEKHQQQLDDTLKVIIRIQTQMEPTKPVVIERDKSDTETTLSPKEFQDYMNMSPENRAEFRKLHPSYRTLPE